MAKATTITKTVTEIQVTLSPEETQFLADVLARLSGKTSISRRKYADSILTALRSEGRDYNYKVPDLEGSIFCKDEVK
jgi:hypothetical protein